MLTNEEKKHILNKFLKNISHISDKDYQRRIWIKGEGAECDDFDETCCRFFDDGSSVLEKNKDFWIKFEAFADDNNWPHKFIDTPKWNEITEMAKEVWKVFDYKK